MEEDDPSSALAHKTLLLQTLISPLSSSTSKLSSRSRTIPSNKDFHFYNNFPEFKLPNKEVSLKVHSSLEALSSSSNLFGSKKQPPLPSDLDDSYDWLVNLNDELIEKFNISLDEFKRVREKEEGKVGGSVLEEGGFQLVRSKKKKGSFMDGTGKDEVLGNSNGAKIGLKDKTVVRTRSKVPFHIPSIPRPQIEFNILVNNGNTPFEHVWLERSEDGARVIHPLEKLSVSDFIDRSIKEVDIPKPLSLESTPFKLVEGVKELKELAVKLRDVSEFAVDLEHNQYRSFQGLTCLMQISTRTEDFIIDTLKLRVHIGPYLREVFKDPLKRKVMHGADRDIEWLQRDFGIYVCNLFDTGQASRKLQLERNSLEYLLHHFCGVNANKEYQNADWRLRPLPDEMLKYGREDTHYLLHIYDQMRRRLLSASSDENDLLLEVYKHSYDICVHLYQKELLTDTSFLYIYGLQEADFNSTQLSIASELHAWRDKVAREEDESTGYILPNKTLLEIASEMPVSYGKLRRLVKFKNSSIERHFNAIINLIRRAIENSSSFESIAEQLKEARLESTRQKMEHASNNSEMMPCTDNPMDSAISQEGIPGVTRNGENIEASIYDTYPNKENTQTMSTPDMACSLEMADPVGTVEKEVDSGNADMSQSNKKSSVSSVQTLKKQSCSFGALLGNSASRRKLNPSSAHLSEQEKNVNKVERIKSSMILPFHSFSGVENTSKPTPSDSAIKQNQPIATEQQHINLLEETIQLGNDSDENPNREIEAEEKKPISLSDLSASFDQFFQKNKKSKDPEVNIEVKPFDYAAARKNIRLGQVKENDGDEGIDPTPVDSKEKRKGSVPANREVKERGLRRHAFPASGNRSSSYK